jgi:signal peptidase
MSHLRTLRGPLGLAGWLLAGFLGTLLLVVIGALLLGDRPVVVLSGSMEPVFSPGDVLIERGIEPRQVEIGQVVTFHEPGTDRMLTHRVRKIEARGAKLVFTTKGDADNGLQRWAVDPGGELGQPVGRIPAIGRVVMLAKTPLGLIGIVMVPLLLLAGLEIRRIWRPREAETDSLGSGAHSASP